MNKLQIKGQQKFLGFNIPVIEGGFGENQKVMLAKTIAEIHDMELKTVNQLINNNIDEFEVGIDILDLKGNEDFKVISNDLKLSSKFISNSKNIYLLSEQGYFILVGFMKTEKAKEIRKILRREYFAMREIIASDEQLKAMALLKAVEGTNAEERLNGITTYTDLRVKEETKPLLEEIDRQKPAVDGYNQLINTKNGVEISLIAKNLKIGVYNLYKILRSKKVLKTDVYMLGNQKKYGEKHNTPYATHDKYFDVKFYVDENGFERSKVVANTQGQVYLMKKVPKWLEELQLIKENEVIEKENLKKGKEDLEAFLKLGSY